ncbi:hypothetical protein GCM10011409_44400 [Lentibacillus populi]|uniref:DUF3888 domain-containing protein n=1 Tax=Lentibacillus populi TaxID=1827502 RepID=A0A9W5X7J9_9BACI|nr:hypothetical protein [Lentibacillus populi]GGB62341.1 hypothetical protein GCM10011409_44400 [Lentibacillus populi]
MNKILLSIFIFTFLSLGYSEIITEAKTETEIIPQNHPPSVMEEAFLRYLGETILDIMSNHNDKQLFTSSRIEKISRDIANDSYDVSLRVIGFEGPLNPPFKLIRMTIRIPGEQNTNYSVLSYSHRFISDKEFKKLSKNTVD